MIYLLAHPVTQKTEKEREQKKQNEKKENSTDSQIFKEYEEEGYNDDNFHLELKMKTIVKPKSIE